MEPFLIGAIMGFLGGLARGMIGLSKALTSKKKIRWNYYWITVMIAVVIGIFMGSLFNTDPKFSLLAGYAGTDILDGAYKSFKFQSVIVRPKASK